MSLHFDIILLKCHGDLKNKCFNLFLHLSYIPSRIQKYPKLEKGFKLNDMIQFAVLGNNMGQISLSNYIEPSELDYDPSK